MKYQQPYGVTDPNAPYINGNPSTGTMGSIPPAASIEHPQRELVNVILGSQIVPDPADLKQVAKGVRSQRLNYVEDQGLVNALNVQLEPALATYSIGLPIRVKVKTTNTGPSTINAGAGNVSIKKPTGAEVGAGDLPAGGLIELVYDGTNFQMINFGGSGAGPGSVYMVNIPYTVDSSVTPNQITANFSPAITALVPGTIVMVKVATTNTGLTNININGLGNKPVYAQGGEASYPLLACDLVAGDVLIFTYDGTRFWIYANTILNTTTAYPVTSTAQLQALIYALGRKRILPGVTVVINMAAGIYSQIITEHPNADRIVIRGTMLGALPTQADFQKTGNSPAARAQDSANNIAMLRTRYGTEVRFDNATYGGALHHRGAGTMNFENILVTGSNVHAGSATPAVAGVAVGIHSGISCVGVTVWGSGAYGFVTNVGANGVFDKCYATGCFAVGFIATGGSMMLITQCGAYGGGDNGAQVNNGASLSVWHMQGIPNTTDLIPNQIMCNATGGLISTSNGFALNNKGTITNNGVADLNASWASVISNIGSPVFGTTSPAVNVVGNNNSIING